VTYLTFGVSRCECFVRTVSGTPSFFLNGISIDADPSWKLADWQQVTISM
jgi:hypothetical protein